MYLVVREFNRRATPEEIARDFPSLELPDIYQVICYYLKHGPELAEYFETRDREERDLLQANLDKWSPRGLRERLLAGVKAVKWPADENFRNAIVRESRGVFSR